MTILSPLFLTNVFDMTQRIKAGDFYLHINTEGTSLENHPGTEKPLIPEKSDTPEPLEPSPYIYHPNDPFRSQIDKIEAAGSLSPTHKPWVKKAWLHVFVIYPLIGMELFALALIFNGSGAWQGFVLVQLFMIAYFLLSCSVWLNKTKGLPPAKR